MHNWVKENTVSQIVRQQSNIVPEFVYWGKTPFRPFVKICVHPLQVPNYPNSGRCWDIVDKYEVSTFYTAPTLVRSLMRDGDEVMFLSLVSLLRYTRFLLGLHFSWSGYGCDSMTLFLETRPIFSCGISLSRLRNVDFILNWHSILLILLTRKLTPFSCFLII